MVQYLFENGLRKVIPYFFTHRTNCKGRWFDRTLAEVFASEFRDRPVEYYLDQIQNGNFKVFPRSSCALQGEELVEYRIQNGDIVEYQQHQHEPVVPSVSPEVIYEDKELIVVNKPSGIPVHPTQKFYYNSVTEIVQLELGLPKLFPCHRLDKLTSGVLILGKDNVTASRIQTEIQNKTNVEKLYLARVLGQFPEGETVCNDPVINIQTKKSFVAGLPDPKPATTIFNRIAYNHDLNQSIVRCQPVTGRTHQIRIHLRNLGHLIVNDPLYGEGCLLHLVRNEIDQSSFDDLIDEAKQNRDLLISTERCDVCDAILFNDYDPEKLVMWLHSWRYKIGDMTFTTLMPEWCRI